MSFMKMSFLSLLLLVPYLVTGKVYAQEIKGDIKIDIGSDKGIEINADGVATGALPNDAVSPGFNTTDLFQIINVMGGSCLQVNASDADETKSVAEKEVLARLPESERGAARSASRAQLKACDKSNHAQSGQEGARKLSSSESMGGDGSVFEGKLRYYAINPERCNKAGRSGEIVDSEIIATESGYQIVRDNCESLGPGLIQSDGFKALDSRILIANKKIYERFDEFPKVGIFPGDRILVLCTGTWVDEGMMSRTDSLVRAPRNERETSSVGVIEAYVYGPRPLGEIIDKRHIQHFVGAARWDLTSTQKYTARWVQRHKEVLANDPTTLANYMSLGILKPEFYITDEDGRVRNGILRVQASSQIEKYNIYAQCTDYR